MSWRQRYSWEVTHITVGAVAPQLFVDPVTYQIPSNSVADVWVTLTGRLTATTGAGTPGDCISMIRRGTIKNIGGSGATVPVGGLTDTIGVDKTDGTIAPSAVVIVQGTNTAEVSLTGTFTGQTIEWTAFVELRIA